MFCTNVIMWLHILTTRGSLYEEEQKTNFLEKN